MPSKCIATGAGFELEDPGFPVAGELFLRILYALPPSLRENLLFSSSSISLPLQKALQRSLGGAKTVRTHFTRGPLRGQMFECSSSEKYFLLGSSYEDSVQAVLKEVVRPGDVVYDVGAHAGYMTLFLSMLCGPSGHVFAFEPSPINFSRLTRNIELNRVGNIMPVSLAASDTDRAALLSEQSSFSRVLNSGLSPEMKSAQIRMVRLDDFVDRDKHAPPDFVKIDVEGHAGRCLTGMKSLLRNSRPRIACELHGMEEATEVFGILEDCSYQIADIDSPDKFPRHVIATPRPTHKGPSRADEWAPLVGARLGSVSVIIPTKSRPFELEVTVRSVFEQSVLPRELIIVDQSPDDESRLRIEKVYADAPEPAREKTELRYITDPTISGAAVARNRAMEIAGGDIWVFLDDDVYLSPDFLAQLLSVYVRYPQTAGVSGIVTNYSPPSWAFRLWSAIFVRGPFHDDRQPIYWKAGRLRHAEPISVSRFTSALMSFRAAAVRGIRFDDNLPGASAEDVDLCARLEAGTILVIAPGARLVHKRSPLGRSRDHWLRSDSQAAHYLYRRNWNRGIKNRLWFAWLNVGYALAATLSSLRRGSLEPWRSLRAGIAQALAQSGLRCGQNS